MRALIDHILVITSDLTWVVGMFVFLLILFHLLFIVIHPLSARQWKIVDYSWLMLAFISVLGLVGEARQYRAEIELRSDQRAMEQSLSDVRGWYISYQGYICDQAQSLKKMPMDPGQYPALCNWLEGRINDMNLLLQTDEMAPEITPSLADGLKEFTDLIPQKERAILKNRIRRYQDRRQTFLTNLAERDQTYIQRILLILAPLMLAMAIAIRITKVTAEFRDLGKS